MITRALVVEDDDLIAALVGSILHSMHIGMIHAASVEEAEEHIDDVQLFILDCILIGGEDGISFGKRVRAIKADIPVIFMTGTTDPYNSAKMLEITPHIISKPFDNIPTKLRILLCKIMLNTKE